MTGPTFADGALMVAAFGMTAVASVGVYQSLYVMPEYFSDPPASLRRYQADTSWRFWLPLHAATLAALVASLLADRSGPVVVAAACYLASWIATAVFFIPGVIAFNKVDVDGPYSPELAARGRRWLRLSTIRLVLMTAAAVLLVYALGT